MRRCDRSDHRATSPSCDSSRPSSHAAGLSRWGGHEIARRRRLRARVVARARRPRRRRRPRPPGRRPAPERRPAGRRPGRARGRPAVLLVLGRRDRAGRLPHGGALHRGDPRRHVVGDARAGGAEPPGLRSGLPVRRLPDGDARGDGDRARGAGASRLRRRRGRGPRPRRPALRARQLRRRPGAAAAGRPARRPRRHAARAALPARRLRHGSGGPGRRPAPARARLPPDGDGAVRGTHRPAAGAAPHGDGRAVPRRLGLAAAARPGRGLPAQLGRGPVRGDRRAAAGHAGRDGVPARRRGSRAAACVTRASAAIRSRGGRSRRGPRSRR